MPTDLIETDASRIIVRDRSGAKRIDTNDKMFHIIGPRVSGSRNMPLVGSTSAPTPNINQTNDFVVASGRHAACTHVVGAVRFSGTGTWAIPFSRWTALNGGNAVWVMTSSAPSEPSVVFACTYEFFMSGTNLVMRQRVCICDSPSVGLAILAHTIEWKLKTGVWT